MTMALIFSGHVDKKNQFRTLPKRRLWLDKNIKEKIKETG